MPSHRSAPQPLSEDEFADLGDFLAARSPFDVHGLLGLLHALAVAPGKIAPATWLPVVLPNGVAELDGAEATASMRLLMRLHEDVEATVEAEETMTPEPGDNDECRSFAEGYAAGAELDPEWLTDAGRWALAAPVAYLGGRLDLVPSEIVRDIETSFAPDPAKTIRSRLGDLIHAAHDAFADARSASGHRAAHGNARRAPRVGRNDPCPCGSRKKYKRCCIGLEVVARRSS